MLTKFGFSPRSGSGSVFDRPGSELSGIELVITIVVPRGGSGRIAPADVAENVDFAEEWQLLTLGSPYIDDVLPTAAVPVFRIDTFGNSLSIINLALTELLIG